MATAGSGGECSNDFDGRVQFSLIRNAMMCGMACESGRWRSGGVIYSSGGADDGREGMGSDAHRISAAAGVGRFGTVTGSRESGRRGRVQRRETGNRIMFIRHQPLRDRQTAEKGFCCRFLLS
jgi:hypothetical protein